VLNIAGKVPFRDQNGTFARYLLDSGRAILSGSGHFSSDLLVRK
jgi:hypothetical protein